MCGTELPSLPWFVVDKKIQGPDNPTCQLSSNKRQKEGKDGMGKARKGKEMVKDWCGASCVWKSKYEQVVYGQVVLYACMYSCMYACMYVCMDGWMDDWMDG